MTRYLYALGLAMSLLCGCLVDDQNEDGEGKYTPEKGLGSSPSGPVANIGGSENCPPDQAERPGGCTGEGGGGGPTGGSGSTGDTCTIGQPGCSGPQTPTCAWGFYWNDYSGMCTLQTMGSCSYLGPRVNDGYICIFTSASTCTCYPIDPLAGDVEQLGSQLDTYWDEDVVYDVRGKGDTVEKDRYDAIASCMVNCSLKYDAGCEAMNTYTERQVCYDGCQYTQTYPTACESQYIALNTCRAWEAHPAYRCNSAGQPVAQASCLTEQLALAYCKYLNQ